MNTIGLTSASCAVASFGLLMLGFPVGAAVCPLLPEFTQAIASRNLDRAKEIEAKISIDAVCGPLSIRAKLDRTALEVTMAQALPAGSPERERLLVDADQPDVFWAAALLLADLRFAQRRFADAARGYDRAIESIKNPTKTPDDPGTAVKQELVQKAQQALQLAANEDAPGATYVARPVDRAGSLGGGFSESIRGFAVKSVPLPINFVFGTARPTPIGLQAEAELLRAIKEQHPAEVLIVGHTDSVGSDEYNMNLSELRARAVKDFLVSNGVTVPIRIVPRGKREPLVIPDPGSLTIQDINQLNRRVEWRRQ